MRRTAGEPIVAAAPTSGAAVILREIAALVRQRVTAADVSLPVLE